jgi:hypothetical protein
VTSFSCGSVLFLWRLFSDVLPVEEIQRCQHQETAPHYRPKGRGGVRRLNGGGETETTVLGFIVIGLNDSAP